MAEHGVSERFACRVLGQYRSPQHKRAGMVEDEAALTAAIVALALQYGRYGCRRIDRRPDAMRIRPRIVKHVFGTIKDWMGRSYFQMRRLPNVGTEMSLHVLAYNLKQAIALLEAPGLTAAMRG